MPTLYVMEAGKKLSRCMRQRKKTSKTCSGISGGCRSFSIGSYIIMSTLMHQGRATYAFFERNWNLTKRYWGWELVWFVYNAINALSVTLISKNTSMLGKVSQAQIDSLTLYLLI